VQDALNELEFIMGDASTRHGGLRASMGYTNPIMQIRYVEVGNEDDRGGGLESYQKYRFKAFHDAIRNKYPDMNVVASTPNIALPDQAMADYHTYSSPEDLVRKFSMFDNISPEHLTLVSSDSS
jgi:alpha-L-arabinofuranosidase